MTTDLKPGDLVQHPEHGYGVVLKNFPGVPTIYFADKHGYENTTRRFTGWERVETVRPGHVQVRVDDLDPQTLSEWSQYAGCNLVETALLRVGCASIAHQVGQGDQPTQPTESTPPADEQPTSATVTLYCPDCGGAENVTAVMLGRQSNGERRFALREFHAHTCPPAQLDEPTEAGILLRIKRLRYVSIVLRGKVEYVSVDQGGIFGWSHLVDLANKMGESIKLGWGQE